MMTWWTLGYHFLDHFGSTWVPYSSIEPISEHPMTAGVVYLCLRAAYCYFSSGRVRISSIQNFSLCNNRGLLNIKVLKVQNQLPKDNKTRRIGSLSINLFLQEMDLWQLHRWADSQRECYFRKCTRAGGIRGLGKAQSHLFPQVFYQQVSYCEALPYMIYFQNSKNQTQ